MNSWCGYLRATLPVVMAATLSLACPVQAALSPEQVVLVVNSAEPEAYGIARYYMEKRGVPGQNLVMVRTSRQEGVGRDEYEKEIAAPVRDYLSKNSSGGRRLSCLVLVYGLPLRVDPPSPGFFDALRLRELRRRLSVLEEKTQASRDRPGQETKDLREDIDRKKKEISRLSRSRQGASVDSEMALVMEVGHELEGWLPNRYFAGFRGREAPGMPRRGMAVCRLDGPGGADVYRIIDDSLFAERKGLAGRAYFDARWPDRAERSCRHTRPTTGRYTIRPG
jgi:uncharacterized protein (TIGR03790 family)